MERFEILAIRKERIPYILRLADEGGLSPWTEADYRDELVRDGSIALEIEDRDNREPKGFIVARLITKSKTSDSSQAEILNISVHSDYRKLGLGSALLQQVIHAISEHAPATLRLEVRCSNAVAIHFYEKHGFVHEYVRKNFYSNPVEDGLVMKLEV